MQRLNTQEIENAIDQYGEIVLSKENNSVVIMSIEEYKNKIMKKRLIEDLKASEKDIENGKTVSAEIVFKELRDKYGY